MAVSAINRTASVAWSPSNHNTVLLAAATAAHQVDASFNTSASLDIFELNPANLQADLPIRGSIACQERVYKLVWSPYSSGYGSTSHAGLLIAAIDNGLVVYSADAVLSHNQDATVVKRLKSHTGSVHALDVSSVMPNLIVSGASESEVNVYDLERSEILSSGAKSYPLDEVTSVKWNRKIGHIYASSFTNRCVLWDLRKNEPILKLQDSTIRTRYKAIEWNPDIATQLALASDDDHYPCVQIWDLRNASTAVKTLEGHTRGVLSIGWCPHDSGILISAAKDGLVYGWNVAEGERPERIYALPQSKGWPFEISWCPRIPSIFAVSSSDNLIQVCDIVGGKANSENTAVDLPSKQLEDSFPGMHIDHTLQKPAAQSASYSQNIRKAPKWLRRSGALSFALDGKVVQSFWEEGVAGLQLSSLSLADKQIVEKAYVLEQHLNDNTLLLFCQLQAENSSTDQDKLEWECVKTFFDSDQTAAVRRLLILMTRREPSQDSSTERAVVNGQVENSGGSFLIQRGNNAEAAISEALLAGNVLSAVSLCMSSGHEAEGLCLSLIGSQANSSPTFVEARDSFFTSRSTDLSRIIFGLLKQDAQYLLNSTSPLQWKEVALLFANYFPASHFRSLIDQIGQSLDVDGEEASRTMCAILAGNVDKFVDIWFGTSGSATQGSVRQVVEKLLVLSRGVARNQPVVLNQTAARLLSNYCLHLAAQGEARLALRLANIDSSNNLLWTKKQLHSVLPSASVERPVSNQLSAHAPFEKRSSLIPNQSQGPFGLLYNNNVYSTGAPIPQASTTYPSQAPPPPTPHPTQSMFYPYTTRICPEYLPSTRHYYDPTAHSPLATQPGTDDTYSPVPSFQHQKSATGWNDPPPLLSLQNHRSTLSNSSSSSGVLPPAPISQPFPQLTAGMPVPIGTPLPQPQSFQSNVNSPHGYGQSTAVSTGFSNGTLPPYQSSSITNTEASNSDIHSPGLQTAVPEKKAIPAEYLPLSEGFSSVFEQTKARVAAQMDAHSLRKVEDISKKLENLNDCLRHGKLSSVILSGLTQILQCLHNGDYGSALHIQAALTTQCSFLEVGSFLPAIKVLLQLAQRYGQ